MIPTYTTPVGLPIICLAFDWPTQMKIPRTIADDNTENRIHSRGLVMQYEDVLSCSVSLCILLATYTPLTIRQLVRQFRVLAFPTAAVA